MKTATINNTYTQAAAFAALFVEDENIAFQAKADTRRPVFLHFPFTRTIHEQYMVINPFKNDATTRAQEHVASRNGFVIEQDTVSLALQRNWFASMLGKPTIAVFSGNKSIHYMISLIEAVPSTQDETVVNMLKKLFPFADYTVLQDSARLCRTPGATRDNGKIQEIEFVGSKWDRDTLIELLQKHTAHLSQVPYIANSNLKKLHSGKIKTKQTTREMNDDDRLALWKELLQNLVTCGYSITGNSWEYQALQEQTQYMPQNFDLPAAIIQAKETSENIKKKRADKKVFEQAVTSNTADVATWVKTMLAQMNNDDLLQVVRKYYQPEKVNERGKNIVCCCVFHQDKTPSAYIATHEDGIPKFYCSSCNFAGKDAIDIVREARPDMSLIDACQDVFGRKPPIYCNCCQQEITFVNRKPCDLDGKPHQCPKAVDICKRCGEKIRWKDKKPYNLDDSPHTHKKTCENQQQETPSASNAIKTIQINKTSYYEVNDNGVFHIHSVKNKETDEYEQVITKICADPVYVSERLIDIFSSTSQVRLVWGKKECVIPATCLSGNDMKVLTDIGLRILTPNGNEMAKYFLASLNELEAESNFASRNGWLNRKYTQFILGQKIFEPDRQDTIARYDDDALDISAQGCRETWLKLVKQYYSNKYIALAMSASAASFLAAPLGVESSILHLYGDSSCGKSTATLFAASLWGQPMMTQDKSIRRNWNSTPVGIELYFQQMFNLCCFLEDSADVKDDETLVRLVQAFVNGAGKNRGTIAKKNGGLTADRTKNWQALLLSTGEKRITDASNMGGVAARTIEVEVTRIETYKQSQFQAMRTTFADNFGFGADLINFWFLHQEQIKKQFNDYLDLLEKVFPNASDTKSRCFCALALILTGNFLLSQVFGLDEQPQIITLIEGIMADEEPKGSKGVYESLVEYFVSNRSRFGEMETLNGEHTYKASGDKEELGIYHPDMNMVMFHIDKLKLHLNKLKFAISQVAMLKKEKKLVVTPSEGNRYAQKINGVRVRFYAVKMPKDDN